MSEEFQARVLNRKYRLLTELGEGAMGVVYRAEQLDPDGTPQRQVALKTMRREYSAQPDFAQRFLREVRVAMQLRSPHVVTVYDSGRDEDGQLYYTMELVPGPTLKEVFHPGEPLPVGRVLHIAKQLCEALAEAHSLSIVHRDLKPGNIFLEEEQGPDWVKLGDFGIAKVVDEHGSTLTHTGVSPGTPRYMAPEQWTGQAVDGRTDLYALGVVLYELLTGRPPFAAPGQKALGYQHLQQVPPPLPASIPAGLRHQIERLLAKTPDGRPPDALSVRRALEADGAEEEKSTIILGDWQQSGEEEQRTIILGNGQRSGPVVESPTPASVITPHLPGVREKAPRSRGKKVAMIAGGLVLLGGVGVAIRSLAIRTSAPPSAVAPLAAPPGGAQAQSPAPPFPDKPSIIVLPFVNMSKDPDQEYFSDGLTETLTGDLSKISSLFVIARNSAFTYKGKAVKVQDVSKEMGVRYLLEGSVQKTDQWVRITVQLIDATTGYHLWSEQYDRPFKDIFALQDEMVRKIATTLKLQLTLQEQGYIVRKHTDTLEAYDFFLRGAESFGRTTKEGNAQARRMFEQAVALDPQYAEAYAYLSLTYYRERAWGWSTDSQMLERALTLAQQAVALDDSLPTAHSSLSWIYALKQQYEQAIAEGERAIALDPNGANSYVSQAEALLFAGRPEEALRALDHAMRLNPRYPPLHLFELGLAYQWTGRYTEAIATLQVTISRNPNFLHAFHNLAMNYLLQWIAQQSPAAQTLEPAAAAVQRALALNDSLHWSHITLGYIYLYQEQYDQALTEMERGVALAPTEAVSYAALAEVLSRVGRTEDALGTAAQALRLKPVIADSHLNSVGTAYAVAGHYTEAQAPLQRYLSRYANFLPSHLMLAAVYSELGQTAEARAEATEVLRINPNFSLELHKQRMPIKDPAVLERHINALRKAGLK